MSRGATARLFVAVDVPPAVCEALSSWGREVAAGLAPDARERAGGAPLRLLAAQAMHVTLCFLGDRPTTEIPAIAATLDACRAPVGDLTLGAPLLLPPRRPRSLAVEVHDRCGALARLQQALAGSLATVIDWQPERRRFRAHVTVARMGRPPGRSAERRRGSKAPGPPGPHAGLPATPALRFTPSSVVLYRSWLEPAGATYEALCASEIVSSDSNSSAEDEASSSSSGAASQMSVEPFAEGVGSIPSSHSGSEPSAQE
jgi:2'-5' RNA ligase